MFCGRRKSQEFMKKSLRNLKAYGMKIMRIASIMFQAFTIVSSKENLLFLRSTYRRANCDMLVDYLLILFLLVDLLWYLFSRPIYWLLIFQFIQVTERVWCRTMKEKRREGRHTRAKALVSNNSQSLLILLITVLIILFIDEQAK